MIELQPGQVIRSKRVNYRTPRILASLLIAGFALAATFSLRTGTSVTTTGPRPVANTGCTCNIKGGGGHTAAGGGGGTVLVGS